MKFTSESEIAYVLLHLLSGLDHLHSNHRIHRNIKSAHMWESFNIIYCTYGMYRMVDLKGEIKIADFSECTLVWMLVEYH
jgi:serine/threonine protein kinase